MGTYTPQEPASIFSNTVINQIVATRVLTNLKNSDEYQISAEILFRLNRNRTKFSRFRKEKMTKKIRLQENFNRILSDLSLGLYG